MKIGTTNPVTLVIIDAHPVVVEGLSAGFRHEPRIEVIGVASTAESGLKLVQETEPDFAFLGFPLPESSSLNYLRALKALPSNPRVVVMTNSDNTLSCAELVNAGADGYLSKSSRMELFHATIECISHGGCVISQALAGPSFEIIEGKAPAASGTSYHALTARELEVVTRASKGQSNRQIADALFLAPVTIKKYMQSIKRKLGTTDRTQAIHAAIKQGLV